MLHIVVSGLAVSVIMTAGMSAAAEPLKLGDYQLDSITAAASSGFDFRGQWTADDQAGGGGFGIRDGSVRYSEELDFFIPPFAGSGQVDGVVVNATTPNSSISLNVSRVSVETTDDSTIAVDVTPFASGDRTVTAGRKISLPTGETLFITFGAGFDLPGGNV
jgi:hypothetical protein